MPSSKKHAIIGTITSVGTYSIWKEERKEKFSLKELAIVIVAGALFACLPDMLEPAKHNPNHRQFFHSFLVLGILAALLCFLSKKRDKDDKFGDVLIKIMAISYASHLASDFTTPKCLPLA